jgi:RNA polymerase sigma factor (TIGR02999 family)
MGELSEFEGTFGPNGSSGTDDLAPLVYAELRRIASSYFRHERPGHTLQPTALVHEAYLRLADQRVHWESRSHFVGIAARMMRRILVDHARRRQAKRREGGLGVTLDAPGMGDEKRTVDVLALHEALEQLAVLDSRQAALVELKFFGGLNIDETAALLEVSPATVKREWHHARAWLRRTLER